MIAQWNNTPIAQNDETIFLEGNHYFPPDAANQTLLSKSTHHTTCPYKGEASYYHVTVDGQTNENAAWYYPEPKEGFEHIANHIAFWNGVEVTTGPSTPNA